AFAPDCAQAWQKQLNALEQPMHDLQKHFNQLSSEKKHFLHAIDLRTQTQKLQTLFLSHQKSIAEQSRHDHADKEEYKTYTQAWKDVQSHAVQLRELLVQRAENAEHLQ
ncbi:MAG: hypothetical protein AAGJ35_09005, partial [Myxococcota bacterium]